VLWWPHWSGSFQWNIQWWTLRYTCRAYTIGRGNCVIAKIWPGIGAGQHSSNIFNLDDSEDNYTMGDSLIMLLVDTIIYSMLTWYLDAVMPGDLGTPQPFYFPFLVSTVFWLFLYFLQRPKFRYFGHRRKLVKNIGGAHCLPPPIAFPSRPRVLLYVANLIKSNVHFLGICRKSLTN